MQLLPPATVLAAALSFLCLMEEDYLTRIGPGPEVAAALRPLVDSIAEYRSYEYASVGMSAAPSQQYARYRRLATAASDADLLALHEHPAPVVRVYAFEALTYRRGVDRALFARVVDFVSDTARLGYTTGCSGAIATVREFVLATGIHPSAPPPPDLPWRLSPSQVAYVDSLLGYVTASPPPP